MRSAPIRFTLIAATLVACQAAPGCGGTANPVEPVVPAVESIAFDEDRAWQDLTHLVENIGDRRIGTAGSQRTREYIRAELAKLGWIFEEDSFEATPPEGARRKGTVTGTNLIAHWPGTLEQDLWIASHYDTFDRPKFVGANDAGSSTAVLIELGRQLAGDAGTPREGVGIKLVWFDGEEPFYPQPWDDETNSTFGSRHLAGKLQAEGRTDEVLALILLDMVGDKKLGLELEQQSSPWLKQIYRDVATELGYSKYIVGEKAVKDDHRPFLRVGIPAIDLIDFNYDSVANQFWHTDEDTLDKCSAESLGIVGRLVLASLARVEARGLDQGR